MNILKKTDTITRNTLCTQLPIIFLIFVILNISKIDDVIHKVREYKRAESLTNSKG